MMAYEPANKLPSRPAVESTATTSSTSPDTRPRKASDPMKSLPSPKVPVIRTQKPSPTISESSGPLRTPRSGGSDSPQGRNWAELATFMRTQREKGFTEIRNPKDPKNVRFNDKDSVHTLSPGLATPPRHQERGSRPSSPASLPMPRRRFGDDEDWSRRPRHRPSPRGIALDGDERPYSPSPRRTNVAPVPVRSKSPGGDASGRKKYHEGTSPSLPFGARGTGIKPYVDPEGDIPPMPRNYQRTERKIDSADRKKDVGVNGVGLGIHGHGVRAERAGMI
jgi:hypothetical protein